MPNPADPGLPDANHTPWPDWLEDIADADPLVRRILHLTPEQKAQLSIQLWFDEDPELRALALPIASLAAHETLAQEGGE